METKTLENHVIDILPIEEFNEYYHEHIQKFSTFSGNAFLKTLDIPPKFFREQPEETQEELLENRDTFVRESKKFFDKVIVVLKDKDGYILNACRMDTTVAQIAYEKLSSIKDISHKSLERTFYKDGYITLLITDETFSKDNNNRVLIVDFPLLLNKNAVIHKAFYSIEGDFTHVQYEKSIEVSLIGDDANYDNIYEAIIDNKDFFKEELVNCVSQILREPEVISLAVVELKILPKNYREKFEKHLAEITNISSINTYILEKAIMDFDSDVKGYKQVCNLRSVDGIAIKDYLDTFKEVGSLLELESVV